MLFLNRSFDKKRLKALLLWFRLNLSEGAALKAVEILQELGFKSATQGAISLGLDDLKTPASKGGRVFQAQVEVALAHHEHHRGNRTPVELFQHLVDTWHRTSQDLTTEVIQLFHSTERVNPVYMMAFSGARGNISQVRQLVGMRGLMADPRGQIVGFPILSNFREGLTITEYFVSCYGARKGVVDTAIRTADAGYLTRRLADVSHHVVVRTTNCGTHRNIRLRNIKEGEKTILSLANRLVGRVLAEHILISQKTIIYCNSEITPSIASTIASQHSEVPVRSPLSCSLPWGVCQLCYGWGLSEGRRVTLGEAVGIIAAQSIGEPGTQLTLRTFHTGGVFSGELLNEIRAPYAGNVFFPKPLQGLLLRTPHGQIAFLTKVAGKMKISEFLQNNLPPDRTRHPSPDRGMAKRGNAIVSQSLYPSHPLGDQVRGLGNSRDLKSTISISSPSFMIPTLLPLRYKPTLYKEYRNNPRFFTSQNASLFARFKNEVFESPVENKSLQPIPKQSFGLSIEKKKDHEFFIQPSTVIFVKQKEYVYQNQLLAEFSSSTLQSANDQIEITQQVLSETAGQVWFKEIDYGSRKGPGSGALGTHFSSQKLGGIWVLAGKPMSNTSAFINDRASLVQNLSLTPDANSANLGLQRFAKDSNLRFDAKQSFATIYPYGVLASQFFYSLQTFANQSSIASVVTNHSNGSRFLFGNANKPSPSQLRLNKIINEHALTFSTLGGRLPRIPLEVAKRNFVYGLSINQSSTKDTKFCFHTLGFISSQFLFFTCISQNQLPISIPILFCKTYGRCIKSKDKIVSSKQIPTFLSKDKSVAEIYRDLFKSDFLIRESNKTSVINLQEDLHILKYNYVLGYVLITRRNARYSNNSKTSESSVPMPLARNASLFEKKFMELEDLVSKKSDKNETYTKFVTPKILIHRLALRSVFVPFCVPRRGKERGVKKKSFDQKRKNLYKKLFGNLEHRNVGTLLLPRKTLTSFQ